jgi:hypothetical protein
MSAETTPDSLQPLAAAALARRCDPASVPFETTAAFHAPFSIVGQARAEALALGIGVAARFSGTRPHSLAASLAFEQTYGTVDGDSACSPSCARCCRRCRDCRSGSRSR